SLNTIFYNRRDIFSMARLKHHVPQIKEILPLMKFKMPTLDRRAARLAAVGNLWDIRKIAKRRTPTPAFDYVDGAAQSEITIRSEEHTSELQSRFDLVCRLLLEKKNNAERQTAHTTHQQGATR